jgi:hypothetical protein
MDLTWGCRRTGRTLFRTISQLRNPGPRPQTGGRVWTGFPASLSGPCTSRSAVPCLRGWPSAIPAALEAACPSARVSCPPPNPAPPALIRSPSPWITGWLPRPPQVFTLLVTRDDVDWHSITHCVGDSLARTDINSGGGIDVRNLSPVSSRLPAGPRGQSMPARMRDCGTEPQFRARLAIHPNGWSLPPPAGRPPRPGVKLILNHQLTASSLKLVVSDTTQMGVACHRQRGGLLNSGYTPF